MGIFDAISNIAEMAFDPLVSLVTGGPAAAVATVARPPIQTSPFERSEPQMIVNPFEQQRRQQIIAANSIIVLSLYFLELYWLKTEVFSKEVLYETIENIKPENHKKLKEDLENRLGVTIIRFEIGNVNFLRDVAKITVHYKN